MNRSFFVDMDSSDGDYTIDLGNWDPSTARRPVTRSMTRCSSSVATTTSRGSSRVSTTQNVTYRGHQMSLRSSRR